LADIGRYWQILVDIGRFWKILEDDSKGVGDGGSFSG
jgi:hypothetical protein